MTARLKKLLKAWRQSSVFGDSFTGPLAYEEFERRIESAANSFAISFAPMVARGMPDVSPEVRDAFVNRTKLWGVTVGAELTDTERLTAVALCLGLLTWGDTFIDRGDAAMETAVRLLLKEHGSSGSPAAATWRFAIEPERSRAHSPGAANMPTTASPTAQARLSVLGEIVPRIAYLSRPEDAVVLINAPCLNFWAHSLALRRLSQRYLQDERDVFWESNASICAEHSILNAQSFGFAGVWYALYRHEYPDLPSLATVLREPRLMRFLNRLVNAAARVFDDAGDREVDAGSTQWSQPGLNLFNARDPRFIRAFFLFAGIADDRRIAQAVETLQVDSRERDAAIVRLFVDLLREGLKALPEEILRRYGLFITLTKRLIEMGYVNTVGDLALYDGDVNGRRYGGYLC
jgi:hypothetical protein